MDLRIQRRKSVQGPSHFITVPSLRTLLVAIGASSGLPGRSLARFAGEAAQKALAVGESHEHGDFRGCVGPRTRLRLWCQSRL